MQNADDPQWITPTFAFPNGQLREEGVRLWVTQVRGEVRALRFELGVVILGMGGGGHGVDPPGSLPIAGRVISSIHC